MNRHLFEDPHHHTTFPTPTHHPLPPPLLCIFLALPFFLVPAMASALLLHCLSSLPCLLPAWPCLPLVPCLPAAWPPPPGLGLTHYFSLMGRGTIPFQGELSFGFSSVQHTCIHAKAGLGELSWLTVGAVDGEGRPLCGDLKWTVASSHACPLKNFLSPSLLPLTSPHSTPPIHPLTDRQQPLCSSSSLDRHGRDMVAGLELAWFGISTSQTQLAAAWQLNFELTQLSSTLGLTDRQWEDCGSMLHGSCVEDWRAWPSRRTR